MSVAVAQAKSDQSGVYEREDLLNGCQAVAHGVRLADVDVVAAYPIRPYTEVMDAISKLIADGQFDAEGARIIQGAVAHHEKRREAIGRGNDQRFKAVHPARAA